MATPTVDYVLELIDQLPDEDRAALEARLLNRIEAEWSDAVAENRQIAETKGVTDETIDGIIHRRRYGE